MPNRPYRTRHALKAIAKIWLLVDEAREKLHAHAPDSLILSDLNKAEEKITSLYLLLANNEHPSDN